MSRARSTIAIIALAFGLGFAGPASAQSPAADKLAALKSNYRQPAARPVENRALADLGRFGHGAEQASALAGRSLEPRPRPLRFRETELEPIHWNALDGWPADDHAAALATFLASCRPLLRTIPSKGELRPMYHALRDVCRRSLAAGPLAQEQARLFFERNFRPMRISRLGDSAGFLTGYYEPIVEGSRFPTGIFKVPVYRRPPDLVPPSNGSGPGFPNAGQSLRRTGKGELVRYYDRGEILDGALDGRRLEICWIKDQTDALLIQLQGSARIRLEDGLVLRINYDAHNGYPFRPLSRILIERNVIPREEMSTQRIREWMRANPQGAEEMRRQNRSFMFFRIVGLSDDREAIGAQGIPLTPERSIAVDRSLHVYGTPFFIRADLPLSNEKRAVGFGKLMIAQDTGSAIVGPARGDIFWGSGDQAARLAGRIRHPGDFVMLVPRELAEAAVPFPRARPPLIVVAARLPKVTSARGRPYNQAAAQSRNLHRGSRQRNGVTGAHARKPALGRSDPGLGHRRTSRRR